MTLENAVGLHRTLEVWDVVDGYQAHIIDDVTGRSYIETPHESTVLRAIGRLNVMLLELDRLPSLEGRR